MSMTLQGMCTCVCATMWVLGKHQGMVVQCCLSNCIRYEKKSLSMKGCVNCKLFVLNCLLCALNIPEYEWRNKGASSLNTWICNVLLTMLPCNCIEQWTYFSCNKPCYLEIQWIHFSCIFSLDEFLMIYVSVLQDLAKARDLWLEFSKCSEIWQAFWLWQHCCWSVCQISKHFNSLSPALETLQDLAVRHLMLYWISPLCTSIHSVVFLLKHMQCTELNIHFLHTTIDPQTSLIYIQITQIKPAPHG